MIKKGLVLIVLAVLVVACTVHTPGQVIKKNKGWIYRPTGEIEAGLTPHEKKAYQKIFNSVITVCHAKKNPYSKEACYAVHEPEWLWDLALGVENIVRDEKKRKDLPICTIVMENETIPVSFCLEEGESKNISFFPKPPERLPFGEKEKRLKNFLLYMWKGPAYTVSYNEFVVPDFLKHPITFRRENEKIISESFSGKPGEYQITGQKGRVAKMFVFYSPPYFKEMMEQCIPIALLYYFHLLTRD